jgi:diguanylate cyclase (GGDEF)-like protein
MKYLVRDLVNSLRLWLGIVDQNLLFDYTRLLSSVNKAITSSSRKNEFHLKVLEFIRSSCRHQSGYRLYYHLKNKGIKWQCARDDHIIEIPASIRLQQFADEHTVYAFDERIDSLDALKNKSRHAFKRGILFQFFDYYYYMLISDENPARSNDLLAFVTSMADEVKSRVDMQESYSHLQQKMNRLEKTLTVKENELRKSEKSLKKRVYEIHNLLEISNELYSILNLKRLINSALLIILGQVGCQRAFAILYDTIDRNYSKKFVKGIDKEEFEDFIIEVDHPIINFFSRNQRPALVEELMGEEGTRDVAEYLLEHNIEVMAPIYHSERVRGLLGCGDQLYNQTFDQSENDIFNILVNIISISVFNAQTFEEVRNLALTDAMTNLHNYRYFEDRLKEEINRARRNGTCVSIIMLDIDHFKNYNDTLGHQAGDEALRTLGWILKNTVREEDIVNRYGGEEFCIILPGLEKKVISVLGDRIRQKVEEFPFLKENVQPNSRITISLGGATFPDDAENFEDLVYKADQALYQSKNSGRNRLTIYNYTN